MDRTAVANIALGWLGVDRVTDIDTDPGRPAEIIRDNFDALRDATTEDRDWSFAIQRFVLPLDPVAPVYGYSSRYRVPPTVIRLITVETPTLVPALDAFAVSLYPEEIGVGLDWVREGDFILADTLSATINVRAVSQALDPTTWTPAFAQAFAGRLAADLCVAITQDRGLAGDLWKLYAAKLQSASSSDGRQGRSQRVRSSYLALRRR